MKLVATLAAVLFFPLAVMFAIERTWLENSLDLLWFAVFSFVCFVGLVLGFVFGRDRVRALFGSGATVLLLMWLPLQVYFVPESGFISGAAYFVCLLALVYASLLGGGIGYNLYSRRGSKC
jgi:hypothetical protein